MFRLAVIVLLLNNFTAFSQTTIAHEFTYYVGCFFNGTVEVKLQLDDEEIFHVDFKRQEVVVALPKFFDYDLNELIFVDHIYEKALGNRKSCLDVMNYLTVFERSNISPEEKTPPENILYPSDEVELEVENNLICFVTKFFPPSINVIWTKNGDVLTDGVSFSQYGPNNDQTFHQFSTLTFTPKEGDMYGCTVEHSALETPKTTIWEVNTSPPSNVLDVYCGVGLTVALVGVATGTYLLARAHLTQ